MAAFDSFGSARYRDQAERELRKFGRHIHRRTRPGTTDGSGIESLTERELQVARLAADGKTKPQIAAELFRSQKTVETHLGNIFHKIDVSSRVALARAQDTRTAELAGALLLLCLVTGIAAGPEQRRRPAKRVGATRATWPVARASPVHEGPCRP